MLTISQSGKWLRQNHQLQKLIIQEMKMMKVRASLVQEKDRAPLLLLPNHPPILQYLIISGSILQRLRKRAGWILLSDVREKLNVWLKYYQEERKIILSSSEN